MIALTVDTRRARVTEKEIITIGSVGIQVQFTFSDDWDGLARVACFMAGTDGEQTEIALPSTNTCVIPSALLVDANEDEPLMIGAFGVNTAGSIVIPTVWASAGVIRDGVDPGVGSEPPSPEDYWSSVLALATEATDTADEAVAIAGDAFTASTRALEKVEEIDDTIESGVATIEEAGDTQTQAVNDAGAAKIEAVNLAGSTQIGLVTAEGTTQVTRVQDKGTEVINSIPADYTALTQEVSDLNQQLSDNTNTEVIEWNDGHNIQNNVTTAIDIENPSVNSAYRCAVIECTEGDKFTISAETSNVAARVWAFLNTERKVICAEGALLNSNDKVIIAPKNSAYLILNDTAKNKESYKGVLIRTSIIEATENANNIATFNNWNLCNNNAAFVSENQYIRSTGPSSVSQPDYFTVDNIPCTPFEQYEFHSDFSNTNARFVVFYDSNGIVISSVENTTLATAPANSASMSASFYYNIPGVNGSQSKGNYYVKNVKNRNNRNEIQFNSAKLVGAEIEEIHNNNNIRFATINFQFDDGNENDSAIVSIFDARGYKCGFALPTSLQDTDYQRYIEYQNKGYEIISHSTDGVGMNDASVDVSVIEEKLKTSKETLESKGFIINGWVTPSSTMAAKFKSLLRKYYQWGVTAYFGSYNGSGKPYTKPYDGVFNLFRVSLEDTTIENQKAAVDAAIDNYGCLTFYSHSRLLDASGSNLTTSNLVELLNYIREKENSGSCKVENPSTSIIEYFNVRNDDITAGWIDIPVDEVSLNTNIDTPLAWYVSYNPMLKLLSFDVRLRPISAMTSEFTLCTLPITVRGAIPIFNELNVSMRITNNTIIVSSQWNSMAMNRIHLLCRIA